MRYATNSYKCPCVLASACGLNWPMLVVDARANASNSVGDAWPMVANAHAVLARSLGHSCNCLGDVYKSPAIELASCDHAFC
eukprot:1995411-Pleurochrysis_carterae.AAC.1